MPSGRRSPPARLEAWLWTGPLGHLLAGVLDWAQALSGYLLARCARRIARTLRRR